MKHVYHSNIIMEFSVSGVQDWELLMGLKFKKKKTAS